MSERCVIIGSAEISGAFLSGIIRQGDYIIAADGGYDICVLYGYTPDEFAGDRDSCGCGEIPIKTVIFPASKDYTDLQGAIDIGLRRGYKDFILIGCTGKRFDHHYSAVLMLEYLFERESAGEVIDSHNAIILHGGGTKIFSRRKGYKYISILPLDAEINGVITYGLVYGINNKTLKRADSVSVSNEFESDTARITITKGRALIVYSRD